MGRVSPDSELGVGWFWIGLANRKIDDDQLESAHLAPAEGTHQHKFQLIETVQDGNVLKVRVAEHAPAEGLFLWAPARDAGGGIVGAVSRRARGRGDEAGPTLT